FARSGVSRSRAHATGCQKRRRYSPAGVPGPTCVSSGSGAGTSRREYPLNASSPCMARRLAQCAGLAGVDRRRPVALIAVAERQTTGLRARTVIADDLHLRVAAV